MNKNLEFLGSLEHLGLIKRGFEVISIVVTVVKTKKITLEQALKLTCNLIIIFVILHSGNLF